MKVMCIWSPSSDYRPDGCSDLEVRLTYRDSTGHFGQFEVCRNGTWQRTCGSAFFPGDADTACNQLFGRSQGREFSIQYTQTASVLSDTVPMFTDRLLCEPGQPSLRNCPAPTPASVVCAPERQPTVRCQSEWLYSQCPGVPYFFKSTLGYYHFRPSNLPRQLLIIACACWKDVEQ